ncbi:MAG: hypothetical protein M3R15_03125 [Acidobacteriota bacterium]|nr:hypothetical protein [Acidobacteriota bacterium]
MALVEKSGGKSNFTERNVRRRKLTTSELDAQSAEVFADCTTVKAAKLAGKMNWMHTNQLRYFSLGQTLTKLLVEKLARLFKPVRSSRSVRSGFQRMA